MRHLFQHEVLFSAHNETTELESVMLEIMAMTSISVILCLLVTLGDFPSSLGASNNSKIEQQLETEFELREPRSFQARNKEYLIVRSAGFNKISHFTPDGRYINTDSVSNWERFALK